MGYAWWKQRVIDRMIGFISTSVTSSLNHTYYSAITDLQFTLAHALGFSVSTSRLLATDLNTEIKTSDHYEVVLSSVTLYSSVLICIQPIFTIHYEHTLFSSFYSQVFCTNLSYNRSSLFIYLFIYLLTYLLRNKGLAFMYPADVKTMRSHARLGLAHLHSQQDLHHHQ
jgi:hypothetical protein